MPIVGTAGHVDHGKSTLVEALTGRDPDRWDEEKRRGLTIDLGFAWTEINGVELGFVDVPGHERFIKNMLAGVVAVDCALLVVAADSGWMPQTEEHVRVLDMLGATTGIVAITRIDLVDDDTVELASLEITEEVRGTALERWPILPVSAVTGEGLDELRAVIAREASASPSNTTGPFRMWIDRSFVIHGAGAVSTGTVQRGSIDIDGEVEIQPGGTIARVRGIHHHDRPTDVVSAGQRAAINLVGVGVTDLPRGTLLCAPGTSTSTNRFVMTTEPARGFAAIPDRGGFHIHTGTADRAVTIRRITDSAIVVDLSTEVATTVGDRVILRESGRQAVVGGGTVIDPSPPIRIDKNTVKTLALAIGAATSPNDVADALLDARGSVALIALSRDSGGGIPMKGLSVGGTAVASWFADEKLSTALTIVTAYHGKHPRRVGMPSAELATHLGIDRDVLSSFLGARHDLVIDAGSVRRTDFTGTLSQDDEHTWKEVRTQLEASFDVPRASQLAIDREVVHALLRRGDLVRIDDDLVFTARQLDDLVLGVRDLEDGFTVADFRDHFGMTRRQSVPLLEWLDKSGVTRRQGDGRVVRNRLRD